MLSPWSFFEMTERHFKFIDLFAGIGGFHLAMDSLGGECVFASEWDSAAQDTYFENFGIRPSGDITLIDEKDIPDHDVLCAGFPCQPFSKAGKQVGFNDETKGTLFFDIERILKFYHPRYFILENVRNLVAHDGGRTWSTIYHHLNSIGYRMTKEPIIVSPHHFGIPQLRERVVVLGKFDEGNANVPLEITLPKPKSKEECLVDSVLETNCRDSRYKLSDHETEVIDAWDDFHRGIRQKTIGFPVWAEWFKKSPSDEMPKWKSDFVAKNNLLYQENNEFIDGWLERHNNLSGFTPTERKMEWQCGDTIESAWQGIIQMHPSGIRIKRADCFPALVAMVQTPIIGKLRRRMTVREAARLQSFPDQFIPNSDNHQAYKQFGNAVNVEVIRTCAELLFEN